MGFSASVRTLVRVARSPENHALGRRRQEARIDLLKRRIGFASVVGFAAFFGLAAQHAVKSSSGGASNRSAASRSAAATTPTTFFDETSNGFSFGSEDAGTAPSVQQNAVPPSPPVAQTSVS